MGSVKVPFNYHGNPNLINFETDMDLQKWTALRKQTSNISGNTCPNVIEEKGPGFSDDRTYSSKDSIEKTSQELPRQIPSISLNDSDSQVIQSNVSVWGIVEKQQFKVLVDTGAAVTVVSEKFYQEILRARYPLITEGGLDSVRTADGNTVPVRGTVTFSIIMGHNAYVCSASVVVGLSYNIVLGRDFLHDFSAIIDVRGQVVTFVGGNTVTFASENDAPIVSNVKIAKTMVIDAQSESIIPATLATSLQLPVVGLIEALPKLSDRYHLHGACTLSCPCENGEVSFRLLNPSDTPVVLHKGSVIVKFEQLRSPTDIVPLTPNDRLCADAASRQQECQAQPLLAPLRMPADDFHLQFNSLPNPSLTTAENAKLAELLTNFSDIFASSSLDLGHTQLVQHEIDTGDARPNFLSSIVKEVCKLMNTRKANTTAYHPQTDGLVERFNGTLAEGLSMYVSGNQKDWDRHLPLVLFAYRVSPHASTRESPFYLLYGREPRLPIDASLLLPSSSHLSSSVAEHRARIVQNLEHAQHLISANTQLAQQKMKEQYDRTSKPVPFYIGCKVWVYTPKSKKGLSKKLMHNYHGPYRIVARLSPVHFRLRTMDNRPVAVPVHANRMKPYFDPNDRPIDPPSDLNDGFELSESDLPNDSYAEVISSTEPQITRPEDVHPPQEIKDNLT